MVHLYCTCTSLAMKHISNNMNFPAVQGQKSLVFGLMNDTVNVYKFSRQHLQQRSRNKACYCGKVRLYNFKQSTNQNKRAVRILELEQSRNLIFPSCALVTNSTTDTKAFHSGVRQEPRHTGTRKTFTYCTFTNTYLFKHTNTVEMLPFATAHDCAFPLTLQADTQKFEA